MSAVPRVKVLPGAPWDDGYILELLRDDGYDIVVANGYEYTLEGRQRTMRADRAARGTTMRSPGERRKT